MDSDGKAADARTRLARGTAPTAVPTGREIAGSGPVVSGVRGEPSGAAGATGDAAPETAGEGLPQSIQEAVERLIGAIEADEALAEWMQGGA